jgi:hypothetical protein
MEAPTIIVVGVVLALLAALSFILMKISSKEYPTPEEVKTPKFEPRKVTDLSKGTMGMDPIEKPKRKKKRYYNKKKPAVANNAPTEKRSVGRPRKTT